MSIEDFPDFEPTAIEKLMYAELGIILTTEEAEYEMLNCRVHGNEVWAMLSGMDCSFGDPE